MSNYGIVASKVLVPYMSEDTNPAVPADKVSCVVLPDGTYFVGVTFIPWGDAYSGPGFIRVWRLDFNLTVLGTLDIPLTLESWSHIAYLHEDMKVVIHNSWDYDEPVESFMVDCSQATPVVVESSVYAGDHNGYGGYDDGVSSLKLGNGMTLTLTEHGVDVWDGLTHKGVWRPLPTEFWVWFAPSGSLWPKPDDPMVVAAVGWWGDADFWTEITVSAEGIPTAVEMPTSEYQNASEFWRFAAGSPYLGHPVTVAGGDEIVGTYQYWYEHNQTWETHNIYSSFAGLIDYTAPLPEVMFGTVPGNPPVPMTGGAAAVNVHGPMARLDAGKFAAVQEMAFYTYDEFEYVYYQRLLGVDPESETVERLDLVYDPSLFPGGPYGSDEGDTPVTMANGSIGMAADADSGRIIVGTTLVGFMATEPYADQFCVQLWSIQGPSNPDDSNSTVLGSGKPPEAKDATLLGAGATALYTDAWGIRSNEAVVIGTDAYATLGSTTIGDGSGQQVVNSVSLPFNVADELDTYVNPDSLGLRHAFIADTTSEVGTAIAKPAVPAGVSNPLWLRGDTLIPGDLVTSGDVQLAGAADTLSCYGQPGATKGEIASDATGALASLLSALETYGLVIVT